MPSSSSVVDSLLGGVPYGLADEREVLEATEDLADDDHDAWFDALTALGERVEAIADTSAGDEYLRAATYRFAGFRHVLGTRNPSRWQSAWLAHRRCLDEAFAVRAEIERFDVPWGPGPFPAYVIRGGAASTRVLVVQQGFDAALSDTLKHGVLDAVARGWSAVAFDGPGQGATRVVDGIGPIDDWAAVIAAVVDAVQASAERPREFARVALLGVDDGASLALQAAARDPRVVALVCDPGVIRPLDGALARLPSELVIKWREQDDDAVRFQRFVDVAARDPAVGFTVAKLTEPWPDHALYDVLTRLDGWDVTPVLDDVSVPVLVCDPGAGPAYPGQAQELAAALGGRATLLEVRPGMDRPRAIFEWLDEVVPARTDSESSG
jgi:hypothetical protein